jgi:crotonobetainyl-CoA:carnitine CoA-transferase CaiB-like acyl-CoA transferase
MQAFAGIRVLDLTHVLAGPFSTYQLALLGADVIKIEPPGGPDMVRAVGVSAELNAAGMGGDFQAQAANKRAMTLDLATGDGREIFRALVRTADVVVENYQAGSLERLGVGYDVLAALNPRLIYCTVTGYGHTGPYGDRPCYDAVAKAHSGFLAAQHRSHRAADMVIGPSTFDYATGAMAAFAISSALFRRERTGEGQRLDVSMLDAALNLLSVDITNLLIGGESPDPQKWDRQGHPGYRLYDAADGAIMIGAWTGEQTARFWQVLGFPERADAARGQTISEIEETPIAVMAEVQAIVGSRSAAEWERDLTEAQVPAARVRTLAEAIADPQTVHRSTIVDSGQGVRHTRGAFIADADGPEITSPPPPPGVHTVEILHDLGYDDAAIGRLRDAGVV